MVYDVSDNFSPTGDLVSSLVRPGRWYAGSVAFGSRRTQSELRPMTQRGLVPSGAEVIIIGGGIIGLSIAFHLAERGVSDVVIIERDDVASGATAKATGGIRQQFTTEPQIRLSIESVRFYERFEERVGLPLVFRQVGYLFLLSSRAPLESFALGVELQNRLGVPSEMIPVRELKRRYPMIDTAGMVGASFCPTDGSAAPAGRAS